MIDLSFNDATKSLERVTSFYISMLEVQLTDARMSEFKVLRCGGSDIQIGKKHIKRVRFVKFLGLPRDEHLSWKYHLSGLSKKLAKTCGMFFKVRNLLPIDVLISLHNALFLSFLQYGLIVWGQTYASYIDPIFKLQKKAIRAISFQPRMSPSLPIFNDLKLLKLSDFF